MQTLSAQVVLLLLILLLPKTKANIQKLASNIARNGTTVYTFFVHPLGKKYFIYFQSNNKHYRAIAPEQMPDYLSDDNTMNPQPSINYMNNGAWNLYFTAFHPKVLDSAIAAFCLEIIAKHGDPAPRLCNKDPLTLKSAAYLSELFPASKFIFMVRDGRATVHSIISRKVTITGFDLTSYRQCLQKWNSAITTMYNQCKLVGSSRCFMVHYEQLVLHPSESMHRILEFLDVPWNDSVLHHEDQINKPGGVSLSKVERSSDQVIKPVNLEALNKWVGAIPDDVIRDMNEVAPMLAELGYDPRGNPPNYGSPDAFVKDNTRRVKAEARLWESKAKSILTRDEPKESGGGGDDFGGGAEAAGETPA